MEPNKTPFRSYELAVSFYRKARELRAPYYLKDQLDRAASSIALSLKEGSAKESRKDRKRYYQIALGSIREIEAIIDLMHPKADALAPDIDCLARHVYKLCQALS